MSARRMSSQFASPTISTGGQTISRIWSGALFSDPTYGTLYSTYDALATPLFSSVSGVYDSIHHNITPRYVNAYSGTGDNPTVKVASTGGVLRDVIHFQPTQGTLDPVMVFDNVTSTNTGYAKAVTFHVVGTPTVNGSLMSAGDTTTSSATVTSSDNGTARLYVNHVLPATPKVRALGGNACTPITITSCTNANPAVCTTAAPHGLVANEAIEIQTGGIYYQGGGDAYSLQTGVAWNIDPNSLTAAAIPTDSTHFQLYGINAYDGNPADQFTVNTSAWASWASTFTSGSPAPSGTAPAAGYIYYQTGATGGNTVWESDSTRTWRQLYPYLSSYGYPSGLGLTAPTITSHASCNYADAADWMGPPVATASYSGSTVYAAGQTVLSGGTSYVSTQAGNQGNALTNTVWWIPYGAQHLWLSTSDGNLSKILPLYPQWIVQEQPASSELQDYFLNVLTATTTSAGSAPTTSLISGTGLYGAMVTDSGGYYVGVFGTNPSGVSAMSYTAAHSGTAQHVVKGLAAGAATVKQGGTTIATVTVDVSGAASFTESGGGSFQLNVGNASTGTMVSGQGIIGGKVVIQ